MRGGYWQRLIIFPPFIRCGDFSLTKILLYNESRVVFVPSVAENPLFILYIFRPCVRVTWRCFMSRQQWQKN